MTDEAQKALGRSLVAFPQWRWEPGMRFSTPHVQKALIMRRHEDGLCDILHLEGDNRYQFAERRVLPGLGIWPDLTDMTTVHLLLDHLDSFFLQISENSFLMMGHYKVFQGDSLGVVVAQALISRWTLEDEG